MLKRFSEFARQTVLSTAPRYAESLEFGRTSFRPAQIAGRQPSVRKNDALLHVDSFPATPVHGKRILRVFANINPNGAPRLWHVGEPFPKVVRRFVPHLRPPVPGMATLMRLLRLTKSRRSPYDHYMLALEDAMRADSDYQTRAIQAKVEFAPGTSWMCFTDQVSHAALAGQFALEQTFYLPVSAMAAPESSPLYQLQKTLGRRLV